MAIENPRSMFDIDLGELDHPYVSFTTTHEFIERFVAHAVIRALDIIENMGPLFEDYDYHGWVRPLGQFRNKWPTYSSLNARTAWNSIIMEMKSWNALLPLRSWMFHINFICLETIKSSEYYTYEVLWSVPTRAYPEPQVTVAVYFYVATSSKYPLDFPVDVFYYFEGHRFQHTLNSIFKPKWLYDILDMKTMMFKSFKF